MPEMIARGGQTIEELRELQRVAFGLVRKPLSAGRLRGQWKDGRPVCEVAGEFIKPNSRLTSLERIEIYSRSYWYRVLDCLWDDYPGLRAILGDRKFEKLRIAYLNRYPSRSFTLRNLGSRLVEFLIEEAQWTAPHRRMALDMARFEWAQVVAFDGPARPALKVDDLLGKNPARLRLGLQPYLTLLDLSYPLDVFVLAVKKQANALRSEASNAMDEHRTSRRKKRARLPAPGRTYLAVHRYNNDIYFKRLAREAYDLLAAIRDGATVEEAIESSIQSTDGNTDWVTTLQEWFRSWAELGWFCKGR